MDIVKQKGEKISPVKDVMNKFKYSFQGLSYCFKHETSFKFESIGIVVIVILGSIFHITIAQWLLCLISMLSIMVIELLNTAIEATVDMVTSEFHPLAKIAKDCGSAATCITSFIAVIVNISIFITYIF